MHTDETKRKIGEKMSIIQLGENNSQYGTIWINNGIEDKKIKKEELDQYLLDGWFKGRVYKPIKEKRFGDKAATFNTCWIVKDTVVKLIKKEELDQYLLNGWIKGRKIK